MEDGGFDSYESSLIAVTMKPKYKNGTTRSTQKPSLPA
jgi:hypothetical protein